MQLTQFVWQKWSPNALHVDTPYLHALAKIGILFLFCLLVDQIRHASVGRLGMRFWNRFGDPARAMLRPGNGIA